MSNREAGEALQEAVFDALSAALAPVKVFDHVPQETPKSYALVGDISVQDWGTSVEDGTECTVEVECYSSYRGRREIRQLQKKIYDALHHQSLTVEGNNLVLIRFESSATTREGDGLTYRGVSRFVALLEYVSG